MKPDLLRQFHNDAYLRDEVINFIHAYIDQEVLKRVYSGEDVTATADARKLIDASFSELGNLYGITTKATKPTNQAR